MKPVPSHLYAAETLTRAECYRQKLHNSRAFAITIASRSATLHEGLQGLCSYKTSQFETPQSIGTFDGDYGHAPYSAPKYMPSDDYCAL